MEPEVSIGDHYENKCDVFSFGMMMFELLTSRLPFFDRDATFLQKVHIRVGIVSTSLISPQFLFLSLSHSQAKSLFYEYQMEDPNLRPTIPKEIGDFTSWKGNKNNLQQMYSKIQM